MRALKVELQSAETNKSAAKRARALTNDLAKLGKQFRADSVAFHKK